MNNSNSLGLPDHFNEPQPLYKGSFFGAPGEFVTEIDWSRVHSESRYCKAVIDRFERTAYLHRCTIKNVDELYSEELISRVEEDLLHVKDCLRRLNLLLMELESNVQDLKVQEVES